MIYNGSLGKPYWDRGKRSVRNNNMLDAKFASFTTTTPHEAIAGIDLSIDEPDSQKLQKSLDLGIKSSLEIICSTEVMFPFEDVIFHQKQILTDNVNNALQMGPGRFASKKLMQKLEPA